jgi:hypothetical protein
MQGYKFSLNDEDDDNYTLTAFPQRLGFYSPQPMYARICLPVPFTKQCLLQLFLTGATTDSGAYPTSYLMDTRHCFHWSKAAGGVKLTTHPI